MSPENNIDRYLIGLSEREWNVVAFDDDGTKFTIVESLYGIDPPDYLPEEDQKTLRKTKGYIVQTCPDGASHVHIFDDFNAFLETCFYILVSKVAGLECRHDKDLQSGKHLM